MLMLWHLIRRTLLGRKLYYAPLLAVGAAAVIASCTAAPTDTLEPTHLTEQALTPSPDSGSPFPDTSAGPTPTCTPTPTNRPSETPALFPNSIDGSSLPPGATSTTGATPTPENGPDETPPLSPNSKDGSALPADATATAGAAPTAAPHAGETCTKPPDRDLYELALSLIPGVVGPISRVVNPDPVSYAVGRKDIFHLTDIQNVRTYTSQAVLRVVSPHAYWYVEDDVSISQSDLEKAAEVFEEEIYPRVTGALGTEATPGVDNDTHITILHARLRGVGGYFSSVDEYPKIIHQYSNQREMVYINASAYRVGGREYLATLSHELQHAIHWNADSTEETWVNEGLAEAASTIAGYKPVSQAVFLRSPTNSLIHWPTDRPSSVHYGAAFLFFDYLAGHYGSLQDLGLLLKEPEDDIQGINAYLAKLGHNVTFRDVFRDWTVANFLDEEGGGPYSYPDNKVSLQVSTLIDMAEEIRSSIPQFSAEYTAVDVLKGDVKVRFQGQKNNSLLPVSLDGGTCWWSNRGDSISSTLTRVIDLTGEAAATLKFRVWFNVEKDWDYAYLEVSTDGGLTWDIIKAPSTSPANPVGNSFGPGYTGASGGWIDEEVDLKPYVGQRFLLRFHYVTDEAINGAGVCIDDISVPEIGFSDSFGEDAGWEVRGFVRTDNVVPQDYIVQVIEVGDQNRVRELELDEQKQGEILIEGLEHLDDVVVVVAALAAGTLQEAGYTLKVDRVP